MKDREFRGKKSIEAELLTRNMLAGYLKDRGFSVESDKRERQGQTIVAKSSEGVSLSMRVRLCWRREVGQRDSERVRTYSAAQLLAKIRDGDWIGSLKAKIDRERSRGVTHLLFVQRDDIDIKFAALVPLSELVSIWVDQRDISNRLIAEGKLGRRKKNHAMNGSSPTIWLQDDRGGQEVAQALWKHSGVMNIAELPSAAEPGYFAEEVELPSAAMEGAIRQILVNAYERNAANRKACIEAHGTNCSVCGANFESLYGVVAKDYIHVHHLQPLSEVGKAHPVNPVSDMLPVCPNCHAVIHRKVPAYSVDEVRSFLAQQRLVSALSS